MANSTNSTEEIGVPVASPAPSRLKRARRALSGLSLPVLVATMLRLLGIAVSVGSFVSLFLVDKRQLFVASNGMEPRIRTLALAMIAGTFSICALAALVYVAFRYRSDKLARLDRLVRIAAPLAWIWPLPLYFDWAVFNGVGLLRVALAAIWAVGLERTLRTSIAALPENFTLPSWARSSRGLQWSGWIVTLAMCAFFASFCAYYTIMQHHRFGTNGFDLGLFDNLMFNLQHGTWFHATVDRGNLGGNHLQFHANFLAYLFVPFYALHPSSEALLVIQAVVVGAAGIPYYLLAKRKSDSVWIGLLFAALFLGHEGTQGPVFYDFHFLTLGPFFVGWTLYLFETDKRWQLVVCWVLTLLLREDQGAIVGAAALVYLFAGKRPLWALIGGFVGVAWLGLMRFYVMPMNGPGHMFQQHIGIFQGMVAPGSEGFGGVIKTLFTNPAFSLTNLLEMRKAEYLLALGAPFLFLPFRRLRLLFLFAPAALFTLVTVNYAPSVNTRFQYSAYWIPMLILGSLLVIEEWKNEPAGRVRIQAAVWSMLVVGTALSFGGGAFFQQNSFHGGFRKIDFAISQKESRQLEQLRELVRAIPARASVTASETAVPHVSTRKTVHTLRTGLMNPDYILVRNVEVRGGEQGRELLAGVRDGGWGVIKELKDFQLWKRGAPTKDNARALRRVGLHLPPLTPPGGPI